jgi:hypothetical protein
MNTIVMIMLLLLLLLLLLCGTVAFCLGDGLIGKVEYTDGRQQRQRTYRHDCIQWHSLLHVFI